MANEEQLNIISQSVDNWNKWRRKNPENMPDLSGADLSDANLYGADLRGAFLSGAFLSGADLSDADLTGADLRAAYLTGADLRGADLSGADLSNANLGNARIGNTVFGDIDLSEVKRLESVRHIGPSTIGIDTVYLSKGNIPEVFLRGAGVPDNFIAYMRSLARKAFEFYSCFISYSGKDQDFADRIYADLQSKGVRCWFAPEDLKIGDRLRDTIDESIRKYDKLLLVLSKDSVTSNWVEKEVETAMEREDREKRTVLFPIRLDDTVMEIGSGWPADIRRTRHIGDFRQWKSHDAYQNAFDRLMRDLKAAESSS